MSLAAGGGAMSPPRTIGTQQPHPHRSEYDQPRAFGLERSHPLLADEPGPHIRMHRNGLHTRRPPDRGHARVR